MKNFSLKALGAIIFAAGLVVAGAVPAQALNATITVSSFTAGNAAGFTFSTGNTNASGYSTLTIKIYNNSNQPTTFAPVSGCNTFSACHITSVKQGSTTWNAEGIQSGKTVSVLGTVAANNQSQSDIRISFSGVGATTLTNEAIEVVFASGALTAPNTNGDYTAEGTLNASSYLSFTAPVTVTGAPSIVNFIRNRDNMDWTNSTQSSLVQANLNANAFTKSGYYFQGWATSSSGPVVYLDGASFPFTTNTILYAVWDTTPPPVVDNNSSTGSAGDVSLANTGIDTASGISLLAGGLSLALVGAEMFMIARRKRSN